MDHQYCLNCAKCFFYTKEIKNILRGLVCPVYHDGSGNASDRKYSFPSWCDQKHERLDFGCDGIQVFKKMVCGIGLMVIRPFGVTVVVRGKKEFKKLKGISSRNPREGVDKNMPNTFRHCIPRTPYEIFSVASKGGTFRFNLS